MEEGEGEGMFSTSSSLNARTPLESVYIIPQQARQDRQEEGLLRLMPRSFVEFTAAGWWWPSLAYMPLNELGQVCRGGSEKIYDHLWLVVRLVRQEGSESALMPALLVSLPGSIWLATG